MTKALMDSMRCWYRQYTHDINTYKELCGGKREDGYAFIRCSMDKIRSWYFYQKELRNAKILNPRCQKYTVAGFVYHSFGGIRQKYFKVYTDGFHSYEIPLSELEG